MVVDQSHWGRLRVSGAHALQFMHQQTSADFLSLRPGQGCITVLPCPGATVEAGFWT